jgi:hypothetical protein
MSNIDRQRIAAVRTLEAMGCVFRGGEWMAPPMGWPRPATAEADAMHVLLVLRADQLEGCIENSEEVRELTMIAEALEAYECKRWPEGRCQAGRGDAFRSSCPSSGDGPCGARLPLV